MTKVGKREGMSRADEPFQRLLRKMVIRRDRQADAQLQICLTYRKRFPDTFVHRDALWSADKIWTAEERLVDGNRDGSPRNHGCVIDIGEGDDISEGGADVSEGGADAGEGVVNTGEGGT